MSELMFQDLTNDPLLQALPRVAINEHLQPAISNIPLLSKIGEGACGAVYRALVDDVNVVNGEVAIKIMPAPSSSNRSQQLLNDVNAAIAVKSPRLVAILDAGVESELFFQICEYVAGISAQEHLYQLKERLAPGMKEAQALDVCAAAAEGLAAAHQQNVLHLDIRPTSLLIPFSNLNNKELDFTHAQLNDLGLAYNAGAARMLADSECQTGTPGYLAPEQAQESKNLSPATDIFSFGATLYTLLVGQPPFGGLSLSSVLMATINQEVKDLRTWRPDVSRGTSKVIEICLRKDSTQRFTNGAMLLQALKIARAALNDTLDAQMAAIKQIEALAPTSVETVASPSTASQVASKSSAQIHFDTAAPVTTHSALTSSEAEWQDPSLILQEKAPSPRSNARRLLVAALLLIISGVVVWQLGYLDQFMSSSRATATISHQKGIKAIGESTPTVAPIANQIPEKLATAIKADAEIKEAERIAAENKAKIAAADAAKAKEAERIAVENETKAAAENKAKIAAADATKAKEAERIAVENETKAAAIAMTKAQADADAKANEIAQAKAIAGAREKAIAKAKAEAAAKVKEAERVAAENKAKIAVTDAVKAQADTNAKANEIAQAKAIASAQASHSPMSPRETLPKELTLSLDGNMTIDFVLAPAGSFLMGTAQETLTKLARESNADEKDFIDEIPAHQVKMQAFYIARAPVTVAQFKCFVAATQYQTTAEKRGEAIILCDRKWQRVSGASWLKPGFAQTDEHPVVMLSYHDCEAFAAWAARQSGRALRLPTEMEWEYAARGSQNFIYPWGDKWNYKLANHSDKTLKSFCVESWNYSDDDDGDAFTSPVGKHHNQSWCGALDMAGNVFQWCVNSYEKYPQSETAPIILLDSVNVSRNAKRALRGGSYLFRAIDCRAAARRALAPQAWSGDLGMRLVFSP